MEKVAAVKEFFRLPQEALDDIARRLVIKVRTDSLAGNHGVFVAEGEFLPEGLISLLFKDTYAFAIHSFVMNPKCKVCPVFDQMKSLTDHYMN